MRRCRFSTSQFICLGCSVWYETMILYISEQRCRDLSWWLLAGNKLLNVGGSENQSADLKVREPLEDGSSDRWGLRYFHRSLSAPSIIAWGVKWLCVASYSSVAAQREAKLKISLFVHEVWWQRAKKTPLLSKKRCITVWKIQGGKAQITWKIIFCEVEPQLKTAELI